MIEALITGKLFGTAQARTGKNGKPYAMAKVKTTGGDGDSLFVSVIAFADAACAALLALKDGDALALAGTLTVKVWTDRQGVAKPSVDLVAAQVLTVYHLTRKRRAVAGPDQSPPAGEQFPGEHEPMNF